MAAESAVMGIAYANLDRKEYIDPASLNDNGKFPVHQTAHAFHEAMRDAWSGDRILLCADSGDYPWDDYLEGHEEWVDVSKKYAPHEVFFSYRREEGIYVNGYVADDRDMRHPRIVNGRTVAAELAVTIKRAVQEWRAPKGEEA